MTLVENVSVDVDALVHNWWAILIRGLLGVALGIVMFIWPALSLAALVLFFGVYAFIEGVFALVSAVRGRTGAAPRWATVLRGLLGVGVGVVTLLWPGMTLIALLAVIAVWALVGGVLEVAAAGRLRREIQNEWALALSGVLSIGLGVLVLLVPAAGALAVVLWVGAYALVVGILHIVLSVRLRSWGRRHELGSGDMPADLQPAPASHR